MLSVDIHVTNAPASCLAFVAAIGRIQRARWERRRALSDRLPMLPRKVFASSLTQGSAAALGRTRALNRTLQCNRRTVGLLQATSIFSSHIHVSKGKPGRALVGTVRRPSSLALQPAAVPWPERHPAELGHHTRTACYQDRRRYDRPPSLPLPSATAARTRLDCEQLPA